MLFLSVCCEDQGVVTDEVRYRDESPAGFRPKDGRRHLHTDGPHLTRAADAEKGLPLLVSEEQK